MLAYSSQKKRNVSNEYFRMNSPRRRLYRRRTCSAKRLLHGCGCELPAFRIAQTICSMTGSGI